MFKSKKRPTAPTPASGKSSSSSKPFNPAHTHPASISSPTSIQTREHVTDVRAPRKPAAPVEGIQSGGGGGGGAGAGSAEEIEGDGLEELDGGKDGKWSDPKKVHPAWEGFGKGPRGQQEEKRKADEDPKAKL